MAELIFITIESILEMHTTHFLNRQILKQMARPILHVLTNLVFIQVDVQTLQQQSADSVPLLGGDKGAKDDRGEEEDEEVGEEPSSEGADR